MDRKQFRENCILSLAAAGLLWLLVSIVFDFYYDLNDDILIKDIISGIYTGVPEAHNNQMLYPISILLCGLYRITGKVPWFGIAEIACFFISFVIILKSLLKYYDLLWKKAIFTLLFTLMFATVYIWEITMLQYTVIAGILCTSAMAIIYCHESEEKESVAAYLKAVWPALLLLFLAFNIRSELFLLLCPFMAAAGVARWAKEPVKSLKGDVNYKGIFDESNFRKYLSLIGLIASIVIISFAVDKLAYSSSEWKEFREFFDARTELYDFTGIPDYEANRDFYEDIGLEEERYELLINYNFAIDNEINAELLTKVADYAKSGKALNPDGSRYSRTDKSLVTSLGEYLRNVVKPNISPQYDETTPFADESGQFAPFTMFVLLLYIALFVVAFCKKKKSLILSLFILAVFRSISWLYVFHMGRIVPRITHPMYMIEMVLLIAMLSSEVQLAGEKTTKKSIDDYSAPDIALICGCIAASLMVCICLRFIGVRWTEVGAKSDLRENLNSQSIELGKMLASEDSYYYLDVYSTVDWTEKVFETQVSKKNRQLAGGWIAFSPLDEKKKSDFPRNFYFVTLQTEEELGWIRDWSYLKTGIPNTIFELKGSLTGEKGQLNIYEIEQVIYD